MENNNWRAAAPSLATAGIDTTMDTGDWRDLLQPDSRERIINKIMETLKKHLPFSGLEGLQELKKIAVRFEEKIYTDATSQSDYLRKISVKMLTMESKSQNTIPNPANGTKPPNPGATSQSLQPQFRNQGLSLPIPQQANGLQAHQHMLPDNIQNTMASTGVQNSVALQPAMNLVSGLTQTSIPNVSVQMLGVGAQSGNLSLQPNQESVNIMQQPNGGDWQEEAYQMLKQMKETYFPELNEIYQKITAKLQQYDSLPQQPNSALLDKLKIFKLIAERIMSILQMSKSNIQPGLKEKLGPYEKQIINFINANRPRKPIPSMQQGQLSQPHLLPMQQIQSQIPQVQSHDTQMNPQLQAMNLQGSVPGTQQNNMSSLQNNSVFATSSAPTSQQNMMHQLQSGSSMDSGQGNAVSSLQQVTSPQYSVSIQQPSINNLLSPTSVNMMQPNTPFKSNTDTSQLSLPLLKVEHSRNQQQQMPQQQKQQLPAQMQMHQMLQVRQVRQEMGFNKKKLDGLKAQAPLLAILAFILFILCLLFVVSVFEFMLVLSY